MTLDKLIEHCENIANDCCSIIPYKEYYNDIVKYLKDYKKLLENKNELYSL